MKRCISMSVAFEKYASYFEYLCITLLSLKEHLTEKIEVVLWHTEITHEDKNNLLKIYDNITFRDVRINDYIKADKNSAGWFCLEAFSLYEYDKVLSLDCDFICRGDIMPIFDIKCGIGMCKDPSGLYNGGLVLIDKKFLNAEMYKTLLWCKHKEIYLDNDRDKWSKDQKLYNFFFKHKIFELPNKFNYVFGGGSIAGSLMLHYVYKPLCVRGLEQLKKMNPTFLNLWYEYQKKYKEILNG